MTQSITQEFMNSLYRISVELGNHTVIDGENITEYPAVVISRPNVQLNSSKFVISGHYFVQINVWSKNQKELGMVTDKLMLKLIDFIALQNELVVHADLESIAIRNLDEKENNLYRNLIEIEYKNI